MKTLKQIVTLLLFSLITSATFSQNNVHYTMSAEAHALMCPFLSPQLMDRLSKKGAQDVRKNESLQLLFTTTKEQELTDETLFKLIDAVGYESKNFTITRTYEN